MLLMLSLGGSTEQPLWLRWVRSLQCSRERGELYLTPDHLTPPPAAIPRQMAGKDHLKQLQAAVNKLQTSLPREILIW